MSLEFDPKGITVSINGCVSGHNEQDESLPPLVSWFGLRFGLNWVKWNQQTSYLNIYLSKFYLVELTTFNFLFFKIKILNPFF